MSSTIGLPQLALSSAARPRGGIEDVLRGTPYSAYAYSYPHKTAYRPLRPPLALRDIWAGEPTDALFLYLHIPFCEMRCGFCNLFTTANPREQVAEEYLAALWRQARRVREAIGPARFARVAVGGGTPTYLNTGLLEQVFRIAQEVFGVEAGVPSSVETSPRTAQMNKLQLLKSRGVTRVSIGVQSFVEAEVTQSGRAQTNAWVESAIERIRASRFETLNLDLIYGLPGQTVRSWIASIGAALKWRPEELYLYPLYVRPLTGLDRRGINGGRAEEDPRLACYRAAREMLFEEGYEQVSMRMFRRSDSGQTALGGPVYCCQEDGMLGLGCGARSYTRALHYSSEYAVGAAGVREIIDRYIAADDTQFDAVDYGCPLDGTEQRRRFVIKSLLRTEGLDGDAYAARFGSCVLSDLPQVTELIEEGLVEQADGRWIPTAAGLERSDAIGPWLYSDAVRQTMSSFDLH